MSLAQGKKPGMESALRTGQLELFLKFRGKSEPQLSLTHNTATGFLGLLYEFEPLCALCLRYLFGHGTLDLIWGSPARYPHLARAGM